MASLARQSEASVNLWELAKEKALVLFSDLVADLLVSNICSHGILLINR